MSLVKRRVQNPAPSILALVNPKRRRNKMAARRRRRGGRRRTVHACARTTANPRRRYTRRRRSNRSIFARRRHNPSVHRHVRHHRRRRRNPTIGGVSGRDILSFAGAGMVLAIAQPVVGNLVGNFAGNLLSNFTSPAITALTGYGLGMLAEKTGIARTLAHPLKVLGLSTAVIQIVQPYVSNLLGGATAATPQVAQLHGWPQGYSGWNNQRIGALRRGAPRYRRGF